MKKYKIVHFIFALLYLHSATHADPYAYFKKRNLRVNSKFITSQEYDFKNCHKFNKAQESEDKEDYYLTCQEDELKKISEAEALSYKVSPITKRVLRDEFLDTLKDKAINKLKKRIGELKELSLCMAKSNQRNKCREIREHMLKKLRPDIQKTRSLLAQMEMRGKISSKEKPIRFNPNPIHPLTGVRVNSLRDKKEEDGGPEYNALLQHTNDLEESFTVDVKLSKPEIASQAPVVSTHVNRRFKKQNKVYRQEYDKLINQNPILSLLKVSAQESDEAIMKDVKEATEVLISSVQSTLHRILTEDYSDSDIISFSNLIEDELKHRDNEVYCDIAQNLKDQSDLEEFSQELLIAATAITLPIACSISYGLGCALTAVVATEAYTINRALDNYDGEYDQFYSGQSSSERLSDKDVEKQMSIYLAPLSLIGTQATKVLKSAKDYVSTPISKRYDFKQRKELSTLKENLNIRYDRTMELFNPGNKYELSSADQIYLAGILDKMKRYGYTHAEIRDYTQKLVKECKGLSK